MEIHLRSQKYPGLVAYVDDEDYGRVSPYNWHPHVVRNKTYAIAHAGQGKILLHRLILGVRGQVDHKDGDGLNCRKGNLRPASSRQQNRNRAKSLTRAAASPYKGVSDRAKYSKTSPWVARIFVDRKARYLGAFATQEEAARAYDQAARELFGEFARTNFGEI